MQEDTSKTILKSARHFFSGTLLSRITGMLRDVAMASFFGINEATAAFFVAFRLAHLFRRMLGEGALQNAFIPQFEKLRQDGGTEKANYFFLNISLVIGLLLISLIFFTAGSLYFFAGDLELSQGNKHILELTILMLPSLLFICLYGLNSSYLQCEKIYFIPSLAPCIFNIFWILGAYLLKDLSPEKAMYRLTGFVMIGCFAQWLCTVPSVFNSLNRVSGWYKKFKFSCQDVKIIAKPLVLAIMGVSAAQINSGLDAIFARWSDAEGPAALWYAMRLQQLPLALFGIALSGAISPPLARAFRENNRKNYMYFLEFSLVKSFQLMLPITLAIFLLGRYAIDVIYGHGDFMNGAIEKTTMCLWGYGAALIPTTWIFTLSQAFYARDEFRTPTLASFISIVANVFFNALFIGYFGWGAPSIAWATAISAWVNYFMLFYFLRRELGPVLTLSSWKAAANSVIASTAGFLVLNMVTMKLYNPPLLNLLMGTLLFGLPHLLILWLIPREVIALKPTPPP